MIDRKTRRRYRKLRSTIIANSKKFIKFINNTCYTHVDIERDYLKPRISSYMLKADYASVHDCNYEMFLQIHLLDESYPIVELEYNVKLLTERNKESYFKLTESEKYKVDTVSVTVDGIVSDVNDLKYNNLTHIVASVLEEEMETYFTSDIYKLLYKDLDVMLSRAILEKTKKDLEGLNYR